MNTTGEMNPPADYDGCSAAIGKARPVVDHTAVVVEDQADIRGLLTTVLESSGYQVHATENGLEGVELVRTVAPDVVTLDVNVPGIDGFEVARRVRTFSNAYIIFISAFVEPADADRGRAAGGDEYLGKPFRPRDLKARLAGIPSERRRERDAAADAAGVRPPDAGRVTHDELSVIDDRLVVGGTVTTLAGRDLLIARELIAAHGRVRTKEDLALRLRTRVRDQVADADEVRDVERAVETLRHLLETHRSSVRIESQHGLGYRLASSNEA